VPIYEYRRRSDAQCPHCADGFETLQKMADPPLTHCPDCGAPVKRVMSAPTVGSSGRSLSRENLEKHGFTQYRKAGAGEYEKTAGKGPDTITD
jgi:putative FmdB family regulatory protein